MARPYVGGGHHGVGGKLLVDPVSLSDLKLAHFQMDALKWARVNLDVDLVVREVMCADEVSNPLNFCSLRT